MRDAFKPQASALDFVRNSRGANRLTRPIDLVRNWTYVTDLSLQRDHLVWREAERIRVGEWWLLHPFYVYGYAFGELLTQSLFAQRGRLGDKFEPLYLDLLRPGATKDVVELLEPFGLDARKEAFWNDGISVSLGALIEEAEQLSREMGVV